MEKIFQKTVGNYMREMGRKVQNIKPYNVTTIGSNFIEKLAYIYIMKNLTRKN